MYCSIALAGQVQAIDESLLTRWRHRNQPTTMETIIIQAPPCQRHIVMLCRNVMLATYIVACCTIMTHYRRGL